MRATRLLAGVVATGVLAGLAGPALGAPADRADLAADSSEASASDAPDDRRGSRGTTPTTERPSSGTPDVEALAGPLAEQEVEWEDCTTAYGIPAGLLGVRGLECGTVTVPQNWLDPDPEVTFDLNVARVVRSEIGDRAHLGTLFINPGGPGSQAAPFAPALAQRMPDLVRQYNFLAMDPRGTGPGNIAENPQELRYVNTEQTTYDMDFVRVLIGEEKLSYLGYSYGTWLGTWYATLFGENAGPMLLDSATDVTVPSLQDTFLQQSKTLDRQIIEHWFSWIARNPDAVAAEAEERYGERYPDMDWTGFPTTKEGVREAFMAGTGSQRTASTMIQICQSYGAAVFGGDPFVNNDAYLEAAGFCAGLAIALGKDGEAVPDVAVGALTDAVIAQAGLSPAGEQALRSLAAGESAPALVAEEDEDFTYRALYAIACQDGPWTQRATFWERYVAQQIRLYPLGAHMARGFSEGQCAEYESGDGMPEIDEATFPQVAVIQTELDTRTALEAGRASANTLPGAKAIYVDNEGTHGVFPYGTVCVDEPIYRWFVNGRYPGADRRVCQGLPLPLEDRTYESWGKLNVRGVPQPVGAALERSLDEGTLEAEAPVGRLMELTAEQQAADEVLDELFAQADVDALLAQQDLDRADLE